jgi:hypothetical protein
MLIKILIALLFITFPLGQILRWEFLGGQLVLRPNDIIACVLGFYGLYLVYLGSDPVIRNVVCKKQLTGSDPVISALILWYLVMVLSLVVNVFNYTPTQLIISSTYIIRFILYSGLYFIFRDFKVNKYLVNICLAVCLLGFLQYFYIPDITFLTDYGWDPHYYRLVSTFLDPGFTGAILVLGIIITKNKLIKSFLYAAMAFTYSRTSFLMFLICYGVIAFYKKSARIFLTACLVIILTLVVLPRTFGDGTRLSRETSTWARINNWKESLLVWSRAPILGVGYNTYRYATGASLQSHAGAGADASVLLVLATTGIIGFFAYFNLLKTIWQTNKTYLFRASFAGIIVASFFNNALFYPFIMEWLWIILAAKENT